jgi:Tfp pilus assembly protein PilW
MTPVACIRNRMAQESGFTVMELLVASLLGMVVILAAAAIMDSAQSHSSRVAFRVDATQRGRAAMEQVTQRLRSQVCIGTASPITDARNDSVTFYADFGDEVFTPELRRIYVAGGALREEIYLGSGTPPNVTFASTPSQRRLVLEGIEQANNQSGTAVPYFSYYAYNASNPTEPTELLTTPVSATDRARIVRVQIAFRVRAKAQDERVDTTFNNSVIARMANPTEPDQDLRGPQCTV